MALPTDIDSTYDDDGVDARKLHQQHHDTLHGVHNTLTSDADDGLLARDGAGDVEAVSRSTFRSNDEPITFTVAELEQRTGATKTNVASTPVWSFAAGSNQAISGQADLPENWVTFSFELVWTNLGAGSGDVSWRPDVRFCDDGDTITTPSSGTAQSIAAPAQNVREVSDLRTVTNDPGKLMDFTLFRLGASDALGDAAGVSAIRFRRVT